MLDLMRDVLERLRAEVKELQIRYREVREAAFHVVSGLYRQA
jgi:hypothetical protein